MRKKIINWLNLIEQIDGQAPNKVVAFNFGIFENEKGFILYLVGSFEYDENNDEWACIEMPKNEHRYLIFSREKQDKDWKSFLIEITRALKDLEFEGSLNKTIVKNAQAITTGFDEGELIKIR